MKKFIFLTKIILPLLWLLRCIPYKIYIIIGQILGVFLYCILFKTKKIISINIKHCFPQYNKKQRYNLIFKNFLSIGMNILEFIYAIIASKKQLQQLITIDDNFKDIISSNQAHLFLGVHFLCPIIAKYLAVYSSLNIVYRPHKKKFINRVLKKYLYNNYNKAIINTNIIAMIKTLKNNKQLVLLFDVDVGKNKKSVFSTFLNRKASTSILPIILAKYNNCQTHIICFARKKDKTGYILKIHKTITQFPSNDKQYDIDKINNLASEMINEYLDQYLFSYKRFKTQVNKKSRIY